MKIGLVAMSGIRVCDEELLRLGLTLPGFVERSRVIASLPSLGLLTLAGMTPEEHTIEYVEVPDITELESLPGEDDWDMAAISSYSAQINEAYELSERYQEAKIPAVMGGLHVSSLPEEASKFCDSVVIGEGELSWLEVIEDCKKKSLKQFYGSIEEEYDMKDSPMPSFELLELSDYNRLTIQTSRGCPHQCEFCATSPLIARKYKQKPVSMVVNEVNKVLDLWDGHFIEFVDDNAIVNKNYWKELLSGLQDRKFRWFAETDISVSEDEELLTLMRESGCVQVLIGFESPNESGLNNIEMKSNWKLHKLPEYRDAVRKIQSHGIRVTGCFVLGLDGHGPEIFDEIIDFIRETELFDVQITLQTPFPGTPLYRRLKEEKRLLEETNWKRCTLFDLNYIPDKMSVEELRDGFRNLGVYIYGDEFTQWRKDRFKEHLKTVIKEEREKN